ncbi:MAG TPA: hypothetical protein PLD13_11240, partial [Methanoculleus sp.]|nr:hypothetical protein [Methanoculleus sp.]
MKSMTKLIVVAMILAAALVVTPVAAARGITANGTNVFVGEEQLTFAGDGKLLFTYKDVGAIRC